MLNASALGGAARARVIWRETPPQHYGHGVYREAAHVQFDGCDPLSAYDARTIARWRNLVAGPIARAAGLRTLPAYDLAVARWDEHPAVDNAGRETCARAVAAAAADRAASPAPPPPRCDCTHYCVYSAVSAANVALTLNLLADVLNRR